MFSRKFNRGAAAVLAAVVGAGAAHAVTLPPKGQDWVRDAVRVQGDIPGPSRDALFIARSIDGPERGGRAEGAEAPLPTFLRPDRGRADRRVGGHDRDRRRRDHHAPGDTPVGITLPQVAQGPAPVPIPAAAPLLFAALGGLALLGRRRKDRGAGVSEA